MSEGFDVFLCHHSADKPAVKAIAQQLADRGLKPWLGEWELRPGSPRLEELEKQISQSRAAAVFVGSQGLDSAQHLEVGALLGQLVERKCPVIPVLLSGCREPEELPVFLRGLTWVDFGKTEPDPMARLVWGITGKNPERPAPRYPNAETRDLSQALKAAYRRRADLEARSDLEAGGDEMAELTATLLDLRRRIREGGQLKPGDVLLEGRFELLEQVGRGGFAHVWKAYDESEHAVVAVKVLHGQYAQDRTRRERFFRGARHMARLRHPGIVRVIEQACEDGGYHFFVMEYVGGGDLRQAVKAERLSMEERLRVILELGEALTFAHGHSVIHRDVKPGNVLLDKEDRARLTDFDLVRAADTTGGTRTTGLGSFLYAAPEAMMDAREAAAPADVYGLGMTAIFTFHGADLPPIVQRDPEGFAASLEVSDLCRQALRRAVVFDPNARWPTVESLCQALRDAFPRVSSSTAGAKNPGEADEQPLWAAAAGRDNFGRWAEFEVAGVVQRLRWMQSGSLRMGSPEGEQGRRDNEGPQHQVNLSEGFWLADTPCTQELWQAVMEKNPSRFQLPRRPVEQVSWDDCQAFLDRLNELVPGLEARLPTEAQWEYACRADTETGTWVGDLEVLGEHNAPVLDEIAWYGGNSGVDFDLPKGFDSSGWQGKQYDHQVAGTREVRLKNPNPWGLYDMLGNVWEWCADWYGTYNEGTAIEPTGPREGASRVSRGGSWFSLARADRAAYRYCAEPSGRWRDQGFRLALGQDRGAGVPSRGAEPAEP